MTNVQYPIPNKPNNQKLEQLTGLTVYPHSVTQTDDATYFLAHDAGQKRLGILGDVVGFEGEQQGDVTLCPLTTANAAALREKLPWLRPQLLGLQTSAGSGDRLGLATPGHVGHLSGGLARAVGRGRRPPQNDRRH